MQRQQAVQDKAVAGQNGFMMMAPSSRAKWLAADDHDDAANCMLGNTMTS